MEVDKAVSILAVDDLKENLLALEAIFEGTGIRLVTARSGKEALKWLLEEEFACILMDANMPGMDGFETATAIRSRDKTKHIPIIFVTATHKDYLHTVAGYDIGAADYLFKPLVPNILRAKVNVFVELYKKSKEIQYHAEVGAALKAELQSNYKELERMNAELKQLSEEAEAGRDQAIEASKFKSEFLANMSHEIRTPMNGILGMLEVLLKSGLTERQRGYANTSKDAARALLSVINDILDFSKIEVGKLDLAQVEFSPVMVVESIAELLSAQAREHNVSLSTFVDPRLARLVKGDPGRIRQILTNLAGNAVKFSERGEILIRAIVEWQDEASIRVKFSVTDSGIGLTKDEIDTLFKPFVQADLMSMRKQAGTGLGLSISKRLVELMGGEIGVSSVKNHGSTFWFSVPFLRAASESALPGDISALSNIRVLVVDDEPGTREIMHDYLTAWGMRNDTASSVDEAVALLREGVEANDPFQVVLIDLIMPGGDGLQLGKMIREDDRLKKAKLILITGFDKPGTGEEAILLGFNAYLTKPAKQSQLMNVLVTLIHDEPVKVKRKAEPRATAVGHRSELILIAEDHPVNQQVALLLLKGIGFEAQVAENGLKALDLFKRIPYALIFMDCQMPEMDGFETTKAIRKMEALTGKRIPIIAMTAHAIEGNRDECLAVGMDDYLSKPIDPGQLLSITDKWLPRAGAEPANDVPVTEQTYSPDSTAPIDMPRLQDYLGAHVDRFLKLFCEEAPPLIELVRTAISSKDATLLRRQAHQLKGACGTVRADPLYGISRQLELGTTEPDWPALESLMGQLDSEYARLVEFVHSNLKEDGNDA